MSSKVLRLAFVEMTVAVRFIYIIGANDSYKCNHFSCRLSPVTALSATQAENVNTFWCTAEIYWRMIASAECSIAMLYLIS